jgi:Holliday junction resolvase RusA-like endonuclease
MNVGHSEEEYHTVRDPRKRTLIIYGKLAGLNDYTKACRTNKFVGAQMKNKTETLILTYIGKQKIGRFRGKVKLNFRWYEPNRKRDLDNICFAKKFILDALVSSGTIEADGWRCVIGFTDEFFVDARNPRIEVDINEQGMGSD